MPPSQAYRLRVLTNYVAIILGCTFLAVGLSPTVRGAMLGCGVGMVLAGGSGFARRWLARRLLDVN